MEVEAKAFSVRRWRAQSHGLSSLGD